MFVHQLCCQTLTSHHVKCKKVCNTRVWEKAKYHTCMASHFHVCIPSYFVASEVAVQKPMALSTLKIIALDLAWQ